MTRSIITDEKTPSVPEKHLDSGLDSLRKYNHKKRWASLAASMRAADSSPESPSSILETDAPKPEKQIIKDATLKETEPIEILSETSPVIEKASEEVSEPKSDKNTLEQHPNLNIVPDNHEKKDRKNIRITRTKKYQKKQPKKIRNEKKKSEKEGGKEEFLLLMEPVLLSVIYLSFILHPLSERIKKGISLLSFRSGACIFAMILYGCFLFSLYDNNQQPVWDISLADSENIEELQKRQWDNQKVRKMMEEQQKEGQLEEEIEEEMTEGIEELLVQEEEIMPTEPIQSEPVVVQEPQSTISYEPANIWHINYIPWFYAESAPADGSVGMWLPGYFVAHNNTPNGNMIASQPQYVEVDGQIYHLVSAIVDNDDLGDWQFLYARANNGIVLQTCITDDTNWFLHYEPVAGYSGYPYQWTIYPYCVGDGPFDLSGSGG